MHHPQDDGCFGATDHARVEDRSRFEGEPAV